MRFTHFTLTQGGQGIGSAATLEQAVASAKILTEVTSEPVTVIAHLDDGDSREAIFNPDGTNDKIWAIDKGRPLTPTVGQVYANRGGGEYRCLAVETGHPHPDGGSARTSAVFQNIKSGWTFVAKGVIAYIDGSIEWDHSLNGRFEDIKEEDPT